LASIAQGTTCPSCASGSRCRSTASSPGRARVRTTRSGSAACVCTSAREPLELEGGTTFTFVTDGITAALDKARQAAGGKDIAIAGGARAAQQYLAAGLVDEMEINLVPALLGSGERLFDGGGDDLHGLELVRTVAAPRVTHLKFARS
jgi:dihydrofolate reductase